MAYPEEIKGKTTKGGKKLFKTLVGPLPEATLDQEVKTATKKVEKPVAGAGEVNAGGITLPKWEL